jgi:hypothetical protein
MIRTTLIELHEVPGICTGDEYVVSFCPSRPLPPDPMTIEYYQSWLLMNDNTTTY